MLFFIHVNALYDLILTSDNCTDLFNDSIMVLFLFVHFYSVNAPTYSLLLLAVQSHHTCDHCTLSLSPFAVDTLIVMVIVEEEEENKEKKKKKRENGKS